MYNDVIGEFKGRTDNLPKISMSREQLSRYLVNLAKRVEQGRELVNSGQLSPGMQALAAKNLESLEKLKAFYEQLQKNQAQMINGQMSM